MFPQKGVVDNIHSLQFGFSVCRFDYRNTTVCNQCSPLTIASRVQHCVSQPLLTVFLLWATSNWIVLTGFSSLSVHIYVNLNFLAITWLGYTTHNISTTKMHTNTFSLNILALFLCPYFIQKGEFAHSTLDLVKVYRLVYIGCYVVVCSAVFGMQVRAIMPV